MSTSDFLLGADRIVEPSGSNNRQAVLVVVHLVLRPIPSALLKDSAVFHVPVSVDDYQKPIYEDIAVEHVHIQPTNSVRASVQNEEVRLAAVLFVDAKRSSPVYDYLALAATAESIGAQITVTVSNADGTSYEYTVASVDALPDVPSTRVHHTEIGLV